MKRWTSIPKTSPKTTRFGCADVPLRSKNAAENWKQMTNEISVDIKEQEENVAADNHSRNLLCRFQKKCERGLNPVQSRILKQPKDEETSMSCWREVLRDDIIFHRKKLPFLFFIGEDECWKCWKWDEKCKVYSPLSWRSTKSRCSNATWCNEKCRSGPRRSLWSHYGTLEIWQSVYG